MKFIITESQKNKMVKKYLKEQDSGSDGGLSFGDIGRQAIDLTIMLAGPLLIVALVIGLVVSIFQAATQINESTLSFIPKLLGILIALVVAGPWMLTSFEDYFKLVLTNIANFGG